MAINDEKRGEVAAKLRDNLRYMRDNEKWYEYDLDSEKCGNRAYRCIAASVEESGNFIDGNYIHIVETLADLIDRPTCEMKGDPWVEYGRCSHCGAFVRRDAVTNCIGVIRVRYCPNCDARVVGPNGE